MHGFICQRLFHSFRNLKITLEMEIIVASSATCVTCSSGGERWGVCTYVCCWREHLSQKLGNEGAQFENSCTEQHDIIIPKHACYSGRCENSAILVFILHELLSARFPEMYCIHIFLSFGTWFFGVLKVVR